MRYDNGALSEKKALNIFIKIYIPRSNVHYVIGPHVRKIRFDGILLCTLFLRVCVVTSIGDTN